MLSTLVGLGVSSRRSVEDDLRWRNRVLEQRVGELEKRISRLEEEKDANYGEEKERKNRGRRDDFSIGR